MIEKEKVLLKIQIKQNRFKLQIPFSNLQILFNSSVSTPSAPFHCSTKIGTINYQQFSDKKKKKRHHTYILHILRQKNLIFDFMPKSFFSSTLYKLKLDLTYKIYYQTFINIHRTFIQHLYNIYIHLYNLQIIFQVYFSYTFFCHQATIFDSNRKHQKSTY